MLKKTLLAATAAASVALMAAPAQSADKINFILNWVAGGDHAPIYWAKAQGLYEKAGIDLTIEQGKGSTLSSQRVGIGKNQLGLSLIEQGACDRQLLTLQIGPPCPQTKRRSLVDRI